MSVKAVRKMLVKFTLGRQVKNAAVNLINILAAFFKSACVLIFSGAFFESDKKFKRLDFLPGAQKKVPALGQNISSYGLI